MNVKLTIGWQKAIERANKADIHAERLENGDYLVESGNHEGYHVVSLDESGRIFDCSHCAGWQFGGRAHPCKHAGAAALEIARERGYALEPASEKEAIA